ncbi:MAG: FAD-dependent oxidoreductase [Candidatus Woesearchaeota archaeon]
MKVVILGAGVSGINAAINAKKISSNSEVILISEKENIGYSPCALPYTLSNTIKRDRIFEFNKEFLEQLKIKLILGKKIKEISTREKKVFLENKEAISYDKLIIALGSTVFVPEIEDLKKIKFYTLKTIEDFEELNERINWMLKNNKKKVLILGAGFIGLEIAEALVKKKFEVKIIEIKNRILPQMLDGEMSKIVLEELQRNNVEVKLNEKILRIEQGRAFTNKGVYDFDTLIIATGVKPNIEIVKKSGIKTNIGIVVNDKLETSEKDVYACGDCIEIKNKMTGNNCLIQLANIALITSEIAVNNALSNNVIKLDSVIPNSITKIFGLEIASVGITEEEAKNNKIGVFSALINAKTREEYSDGKEIIIKIISDSNEKIIGAQIIGKEYVALRADLIALAIKKECKLKDLIYLENAYSPLTTPAIEPISIASKYCLKKINAARASSNGK